MLRVEEYDIFLQMAQRMGSISFYMQSLGELATTIGVGVGLEDRDLLFP
jgi:TPP-dependent pyruvate/acetoin dehydrogenase alpha subunit